MKAHNEPWEVKGNVITIANGRWVMAAYGSEKMEYVRRAVLCVNACAGMDSEFIEHMPILRTLYRDALKERDQFLSDADKLITHGVTLQSRLDEAVGELGSMLAWIEPRLRADKMSTMIEVDSADIRRIKAFLAKHKETQ